MEQVRPVLIVGPDSSSKGFHPILPVPLGQMLQEIIHRIVERDIVGVDITHDVLIPALDALRQGVDGDGVTCLGGQVLECETMSRPDAVFGHATHHVLTEFIIAVQEDVDLHHQQRLRWDILRGTYLVLPLIILFLMFLTVGILENLRHHVWIFAIGQLHQRLTSGKGHIKARLTTVFCQACDDQCVALLAFIIHEERHVVVGFREIILVDEALRLVTVAPWHDIIWHIRLLLDGLEGLCQVRSIGIERP